MQVDLQNVHLVAKEQHRRKRRLQRLNKLNKASKRRRGHRLRKRHKVKRSKWPSLRTLAEDWLQSFGTDTVSEVLTVPALCSGHIAVPPVANPTHSPHSALSEAESTPPTDHSLSSYFAAMERYFEGQRMKELRLPSELVHRLTALYATPTERFDVGSMLQSVRFGHYDNAQVAVIGTAGDDDLAGLGGNDRILGLAGERNRL